VRWDVLSVPPRVQACSLKYVSVSITRSRVFDARKKLKPPESANA